MAISKEDTLRILITGDGHPVAKGVLESLRRSSDYNLYIVGMDLKERGNSFEWVDKHHIMPAPGDDEYVKILLDVCLLENIQLVIPWSDDEVEVISREASVFEENGIALLCSPYDSIRSTIDKGLLLKELQKTDIPVPDFEFADSPEEVENAAIKLGYPEKPVVVKPRRSSCAKGFWILEPEIDLKQFYPSQKLSLKAFTVLLHEAHDKGQNIPEYIVMQYLQGDDYSVDALANNGEPLYIVPRRRIKAVEGISQISEVVDNEEVQAVVASIIKTFSLHLNVNIQLRYPHDLSSSPLVYEVNPRISGSIVANDGAGVKLFYYGILLALNKPLPKREEVRIMPTRMSRYWTEKFDHLGKWFKP
jgi:carbamoyl-phosphate synthase large subunit